MTCLRKLLVPGVQMTDQELQDLVSEIEEYEQNMVKAEAQMRSSTSASMSAHAATMEVLGVAGKVKHHERFRKKGVRDVRCMFCTMAFEKYGSTKETYIDCPLESVYSYCEYFS